MNVAVIENDSNHIEMLKHEISNLGQFDFFYNSIEFGKSDLDKYDVIIADYSLNTISGKDLIRSVSSKSKAQFFLMNSVSERFSEEDVENEHIAGLIIKDDIDSFKEHLRYIDVKLRINKILEENKNKYEGLLINEESYEIEEFEDYISVTLFDQVNERKRITEEIEKTEKYNVLVSFGNMTHIGSLLLSELVFLYSYIKSKKGKMIFLDTYNYTNILHLCNLDQIFLIINKKEDALKLFIK